MKTFTITLDENVDENESDLPPFTITLDENEFDLLRFFVDSFEDDYTEGRDDTIGDENAEDVYERLQQKLS